MKSMKAICTLNEGNDFDPEVGEIVEMEDLYITRLWREGSEIDLEDKKRQGYFKPEEVILSMLKKGDVVEENYCHGLYKVL